MTTTHTTIAVLDIRGERTSPTHPRRGRIVSLHATQDAAESALDAEIERQLGSDRGAQPHLMWTIGAVEPGDEIGDRVTYTVPVDVEEVDDHAIRALRREAIEGGDDMQLLICERALDSGEWDNDEWSGGGHKMTTAQWSRLRRMTQAQARVQCARVIAEARAQAVRS